ncbi:hypothetical protein ES707_10222 [subsurface metagenome]
MIEFSGVIKITTKMKNKTTVEIYCTVPIPLFKCNKCKLIFRPLLKNSNNFDITNLSCPNNCKAESDIAK